MKTTIQEEIGIAIEQSYHKGLDPQDPHFWSSAMSFFEKTAEEREEEYKRKINTLKAREAEIEARFMRRQAY